jgi:hypothetical protein
VYLHGIIESFYTYPEISSCACGIRFFVIGRPVTVTGMRARGKSAEADGGKGSPVKQKIVAGVITLIVGGAPWWWSPASSIFRKVADHYRSGGRDINFNVRTLALPPAHPQGEVVGGITWDTRDTDVRLDVVNGLAAIQNLDIKISVDGDKGIVAVGQLSNFQSITTFRTDEPFPGRPAPPTGLRIVNDDGTIFPADPYKGRTVQYSYRIHCDNMLPESTIRFIVALSSLMGPSPVTVINLATDGSLPPPQAPKGQTGGEVGPAAPLVMHITASYETRTADGRQSHSIDVKKPISN